MPASSHQTSSQPAAPPQSPEKKWEADAIVTERLLGLGDDDAEMHARHRLRQACDDITLDEVDDRCVYGNKEGLHVLEDLRDMRHEMKKIADKINHKFEVMENEITRLRVDVDGYLKTKYSKWSQEEALTIRRRFLDHYKRDVLKLPEFKGADAIKAGNAIAHQGNALSDAYLFKRDDRMDFTTYRSLYGLQHNQVLKYYENGIDGGIFSVLNAHATLVMAEGKQITSELEEAFRNFVVLAECCYPSTPMEDEKTPRIISPLIIDIYVTDPPNKCRAHVMTLRDHFELLGPNGTHRCLVFEVMGPSAEAIAGDLHYDSEGRPRKSNRARANGDETAQKEQSELRKDALETIHEQACDDPPAHEPPKQGADCNDAASRDDSDDTDQSYDSLED